MNMIVAIITSMFSATDPTQVNLTFDLGSDREVRDIHFFSFSKSYVFCSYVAAIKRDVLKIKLDSFLQL